MVEIKGFLCLCFAIFFFISKCEITQIDDAKTEEVAKLLRKYFCGHCDVAGPIC